MILPDYQFWPTAQEAADSVPEILLVRCPHCEVSQSTPLTFRVTCKGCHKPFDTKVGREHMRASLSAW